MPGLDAPALEDVITKRAKAIAWPVPVRSWNDGLGFAPDDPGLGHATAGVDWSEIDGARHIAAACSRARQPSALICLSAIVGRRPPGGIAAMREVLALPTPLRSLASRFRSAVMGWYRRNVLGEEGPSAEESREAELRSIAKRLEPAVMDWYQRHVLGEDSALRPPADLVSSVSLRSSDAEPVSGFYRSDTHTVHIGAWMMDKFRGSHDAVPFVVAHELGHAVQATAAARALEHGEGRDAPFTEQMRGYLDVVNHYSESVKGTEKLRGLYAPECRSPAELRADYAVEHSGPTLARHLHTAELAEPVFRERVRMEGYADDFASDVVRASYEPGVARAMLGEASQVLASIDTRPRCAAERDDNFRARADDDHLPLRLHPAAAHRTANILGDGGPHEVPLARPPAVSTASGPMPLADRDPALPESFDQHSSVVKIRVLRAERTRVASRLEGLDRSGPDRDRSSLDLSRSPRVRGQRALSAPSSDPGVSPDAVRSNEAARESSRGLER